jgi:hypothetical protein
LRAGPIASSEEASQELRSRPSTLRWSWATPFRRITRMGRSLLPAAPAVPHWGRIAQGQVVHEKGVEMGGVLSQITGAATVIIGPEAPGQPPACSRRCRGDGHLPGGLRLETEDPQSNAPRSLSQRACRRNSCRGLVACSRTSRRCMIPVENRSSRLPLECICTAWHIAKYHYND